MSRLESDLHTSLDWVAVAHFNTEHPHVHVALRDLDTTGEEFKLDRDYVKNGLRAVAPREKNEPRPDNPVLYFKV